MIREDMKFDVRTLNYRRRRQEVESKEFDRYLADLPDDADEAEPTKTVFVPAFEEKNYKQ